MVVFGGEENTSRKGGGEREREGWGGEWEVGEYGRADEEVGMVRGRGRREKREDKGVNQV